MKEANIVKGILQALRQRGAWVTKLHGGPLQQSGLPDLLAVLGGRAYFLEVKRPGEEATPLQAHTLQRLREAGARARVVTSVEEAVDFVFRNAEDRTW